MPALSFRVKTPGAILPASVTIELCIATEQKDFMMMAEPAIHTAL